MKHHIAQHRYVKAGESCGVRIYVTVSARCWQCVANWNNKQKVFQTFKAEACIHVISGGNQRARSRWSLFLSASEIYNYYKQIPGLRLQWGEIYTRSGRIICSRKKKSFDKRWEVKLKHIIVLNDRKFRNEWKM